MAKDVSDNCVKLIKKFEGCKLTAYKDSVGVWTIGYGTTNADKSITNTTIKEGLKISQETADNWLKKSLANKYLKNVLKYDDKYDWNQNQLDALVCFAYNIGSIDGLVGKGSRSIEQISNTIPAYNKAGGKVLNGLVKRRAAEKELFDTPIATASNNTKSINIPSGSPVLKKGSEGAKVELLQKVINKVLKSSIEVDGDFGNTTMNEVKSLQNLIGVSADGEYGTDTAKALKKYLKAKNYTVKTK